MTIVVNVTENTKIIKLNAIQMDINQKFTRIQPYPINKYDNNEQKIEIINQFEDNAMEFYTMETNKILKTGQQYLIHIKFVNEINEENVGFFRIPYFIDGKIR